MSNVNNINNNINMMYGEYPWKEDPHRCGNAPFVPQIMPDGTQNSCGSYCAGFDGSGCNKYLPNYPDDYYLLDYVASGGDCKDFEDCKRDITPVPNGEECNKGVNFSIQNNTIVENFGNVFDTDYFNLALWAIVIILTLRLIFVGCK